MADHCPHLREPTEEAWKRLRNPLRWACDSCGSTDGIWCCLSCGHIGCGRRAHLPALGGGHSKHHFHTTHSAAEASSASSGVDKKKRVKILKKFRSSKKISEGDDPARAENEQMDCVSNGGAHEVVIDVVSKAVHCYVCDDYVLSDAPWLEKLRRELSQIELRRDAMEPHGRQPQEVFADADYEMVSHPERDVNMSFPDEDGKVSDEAELGDTASAPPPAPAPAPALAPGTTGLVNLGNTCYMNSVLQMLSHCSGFRSFFRDFLRAAAPLRLAGEGGYQLTRQSTMRLKDELHKNKPPDKLALTEATHALLRVLWSGRWPSISPRYFVNAVWKHSILFAARKQQDANEFLNFYLGRVDDELKPRKATNSVMMDLFGVDQYQEVRCDECKTVTKRTEPLLGLVLSLPDDLDSGDGVPGSAGERKNDHAIDLLNCFQSLQTTGRFVGENQFYCDTCRAKTDAEWRVSLQGRPQSLLISLRRTLWNKERGLHKDGRRVEFPIEFDASDLLGMGKAKSPDADFEGCHYRLAAVVSHSGSTPFVGHYICYARDEGGGGWFLFNDSNVSPASEAGVLEVEAFILLYERQTIPSIGSSGGR